MNNSYNFALMKEWDEKEVEYKIHEDRKLPVLFMGIILLLSSKQW